MIMMKMMKNKLIVYPCIVLLILLIFPGCSLMSESPAIDSENTGAEEGQSSIVSTTAIVVPSQEATLRFKNKANNLHILARKGEQVRSGDVLVESDTVQQTLKLAEAKAQLTNAQALYDALLREELREVRQSEKEAAFEQIEAAEAAIDLAEENLSATRISAPFDGAIIDIFIDPFENVFAGEPILLMADMDNFVIETDDLDEKEAARVEVGDRVEIFFDVIPEETVYGVVAKIAEKSTSGAGNDFTVTISVPASVENLRWGMSAYIEIDAGSADADTMASEQAEAAETPAANADSARDPERRICETMDFLSETVPDGTVINPGEVFSKSWTFRNIGTCTWDTNYRMVYVSGDPMGGAHEIPFPGYTAPDDLMTITLPLTAPQDEGEHRGDWQIQNDLGAKLYDVWVEITVEETN